MPQFALALSPATEKACELEPACMDMLKKIAREAVEACDLEDIKSSQIRDMATTAGERCARCIDVKSSPTGPVILKVWLSWNPKLDRWEVFVEAGPEGCVERSRIPQEYN